MIQNTYVDYTLEAIRQADHPLAPALTKKVWQPDRDPLRMWRDVTMHSFYTGRDKYASSYLSFTGDSSRMPWVEGDGLRDHLA